MSKIVEKLTLYTCESSDKICPSFHRNICESKLQLSFHELKTTNIQIETEPMKRNCCRPEIRLREERCAWSALFLKTLCHFWD